jgi:RimJ/RimL family protein N-acetyltransferase
MRPRAFVMRHRAERSGACRRRGRRGGRSAPPPKRRQADCRTRPIGSPGAPADSQAHPAPAARAALGRIGQCPPTFNTRRFVVVPLTPSKLRELAGVLLQDAALAELLPWMQHKTADAALQEARFLELQCASGAVHAWGIVDRSRKVFIGAALAREAIGGIDLEVFCASRFWNQGVADEVAAPVAGWLEDHTEEHPVLPH